MLTGRIALLEYNVPGPVVIHERLVLDHIADDDYIVCTPDRDIFCEQLSVQNPDLRSFRLRIQQGNRLPPGVVPGQVYGLPRWSQNQLATIRADGSEEANAERARRGVGVAPPVVALGGGGALAVAPPAAPNATPIPGNDGVPQPPGAGQVAAGSLVWVAAEAAHGKRYGGHMDEVADAMVRHAKTVHSIGDGKTIFCVCIGAEDVEEFNNRPSLCDGRVVSRKQNALGSPEITLVEAVSKAVQFEMGWKLTGPRTSKWCLNYLVVEGLGFEAHHERFRQLCRVESTTWGVQEHFQLSMMLRQLIQVDMVNGFNSLGVELMFRRVQTIEYAHSEKARESEARSSGGKLALEEQYMFGSLVRQAGTLMICPQLLQHVKEEVEKDVQLQKNLRKAKEERELAAKAKGKKKQDENPETEGRLIRLGRLSSWGPRPF